MRPVHGDHEILNCTTQGLWHGPPVLPVRCISPMKQMGILPVTIMPIYSVIPFSPVVLFLLTLDKCGTPFLDISEMAVLYYKKVLSRATQYRSGCLSFELNWIADGTILIFLQLLQT